MSENEIKDGKNENDSIHDEIKELLDELRDNSREIEEIKERKQKRAP